MYRPGPSLSTPARPLRHPCVLFRRSLSSSALPARLPPSLAVAPSHRVAVRFRISPVLSGSLDQIEVQNSLVLTSAGGWAGGGVAGLPESAKCNVRPVLFFFSRQNRRRWREERTRGALGA